MNATPHRTTPASIGEVHPGCAKVAVGIDIGGTKTQVTVARRGGRAESVTAPSISWCRGHILSEVDNARRLLAIVERIAPLTEVCALAVGAHDCDTPQQCARFTANLRSFLPPSTRINVVNDAFLVAPAFGDPTAIAVIAGTGSIVTALDSADTPIVVGGHGWLLGDPGSAPGLVRESVRATLRQHDAAQPRDLLTTMLMCHFDAEDEVELGYALSTEPDVHRWAGAAPLVFEAAERGSRLAAFVIDRAARDLAEQVHLAVRRGAMARAVVCAGGVIVNQPLLFDSVKTHVNTLIPGSSVSILDRPPVDGAVSMAEHALTGRYAIQDGDDVRCSERYASMSS